MPARFQLVIDCKDPELLARFWAAALGYVLEPPPEGFATWDDWRRDIGLPDSELGIGADSIVDPGGGRPPHLHGDPERIRQVLDNLLSNARHATPEGGQITIRSDTTGIDVEVTDTGPGVPKPDRERIFQRFTLLNGTYPIGTDGNGLGLAIARSVATAHSGTLTCEATDGEGARFQLQLPRTR